MTNLKFMQKLFFLLVLGFSLFTLQACSSDEDDTIDEEAMADPANDYGEITENSLVATGGYRDVKPLRATILSSINTTYQGAYSSFGVEFTPHQPDFNSSETRSVNSNSGVTNGHFETVLSSGGEGLLEAGTTNYYRSYAYMGGSRYNGETRSFVTPDLQVSGGTFVDLGVSVKWASCNMGAKAPETIETLVKQCYAFNCFNVDRADKFPLSDIANGAGTLPNVPESVNDGNWLETSNYDIATRTLGSGYRIPTEWEWQELEDECYWKSGAYNGVKGFYISDKTDGTAVIFLPYVKKSSQHDITVYLSAPDDIIWNLREVIELEIQYYLDLKSFQGTPEDFKNFENNYIYDRLSIDKEFGVGEVLTETTHTHCDYGLILRAIDSYFASCISTSDFNWTHPITDKVYNFYEENGVNGSGVLYVRPVSNR